MSGSTSDGVKLRRELLNLCIDLLESYNPSCMTPSSHVEQFVKEKKVRDESTALFLQEVMYGTQRYSKMLRVIVDGLYARHPSQVNRLDRALYIIMVYLTMFRIAELTFPEFKALIKSQEPHKMHVFLKFLYNKDTMKTWLRDQLLTIYDYTYVDEELIGLETNKRGMHRFLEPMLELLSDLDSLLRPKTSASKEEQTKNVKTSPTFTKPQPFNLTQPKPRKLPEPDHKLSTEYKARPIPESLFQTNLQKIEERRKKQASENREKALRVHQNQPEDAVLKRLDKHKKKSEKIKKALKSKIDAEIATILKPANEQAHVIKTKKYYEKVKGSKVNHEIKPTTAAILREDAMFRKKQEEEAAIIREYEVNLRDTSEYDEWKAREEAREEKMREEMLKQRKELLTKASEIAKKAVEENEVSKREAASEMREERQQVLELLEIERKQEMEENQLRTLEVQKAREQAKEAIIQVEQEKKLKAARMQSELEKLRKFREKEQEAEMKQKKELIKEIQAMVAEALVKSKVPKEFDPTTTSGVGLLEEMSLNELKARMLKLKEKTAIETKEKRGRLRNARDSKKEELALKMKRINRLRKQNTDANETRRAQKHQSALEIAAALREKREKDVLAMHRKLQSAREKKRAEALRLAKDLKKRQIAKTFLEADAAKVEDRKWKEIQRGQGRQAQVAQALKHAKARKRTSIKNKETAQRKQNATIAAKRTKEFRKMVDEKTRLGLRDMEKRKEEEAMVNTLNARSVKLDREKLAQKTLEDNPYETTMKKTQLRDARDFTRTGGTLARAGQAISS
eukprot:CAMPEP_0184498302 /NCGR_PEP_ID=MMETSP0113_2-20130426/38614_1 /TAXON_ID=91329 /ORGANISM="Norrisiella sphaerica, Strain BC52" /LENGTH=798 /DNA_ID=CAMNT_0026885751 /DNA_START=170 /DNA_END=2566 /DNA_ORIENTATION=-